MDSHEASTSKGRNRVLSILRSARIRNYEENDSEHDFSSTDEGDLYIPTNNESDSSEIDETITSIHNDITQSANMENLGEVEQDNVAQNNSTRGRKKRRQEHTWGKNLRKLKRATGKEYVNTRGDTVPAKVFVATECVCRLKCSELVPSSVQRDLHDAFYNLGSWNSQTVYLCSAVTISAPKRPQQRARNQTPSRKQHTRQFMLNNINVCKKFFLNVLQISNHRLDYALQVKQATSNTNIPTEDQRGRKVPGNKISDEKLEWIRDHIRSFPKYKSHYGERSSDRQYLAPNLSITKMYTLFVEKCQTDGKEILKKSLYEKVFRTDFNLHFYIPKKDTCKTCDELKISLAAETDIEQCIAIRNKIDTHTNLATKAREMLNPKKKTSLATESTEVLITFDLERTLPLPHLNTGEVYYLRQLNMLNFGIHSYQHDGENILMNLWYETTGARGSQEVTSCLYFYFKNHLPARVSRLNLFSDCCGGQNRNWNLMFFAVFMVNTLSNINEIYVNYLVTGHTYLPNDGDFSFISRAQNKQSHIYTPDEWAELIKKCKKHKPFGVNNMVGKFVSFDQLQTVFKEYHTLVADGAMISKIRRAKFVRNQSVIMFNDDYSETYRTVDLRKNTVNLDDFLEFLQNYTPRDESDARSLSFKKMQDIRKILKFVPPVHHPFYLNLPHRNRRGESNEQEENLPALRDDGSD